MQDKRSKKRIRSLQLLCLLYALYDRGEQRSKNNVLNLFLEILALDQDSAENRRVQLAVCKTLLFMHSERNTQRELEKVVVGNERPADVQQLLELLFRVVRFGGQLGAATEGRRQPTRLTQTAADAMLVGLYSVAKRQCTSR